MSLRVSPHFFHVSLKDSANWFAQNVNTGSLLTSVPGCPGTALVDPYEFWCPMRSTVHPNFKISKCMDVRSADYTNGTPVQMSVCFRQVMLQCLFTSILFTQLWLQWHRCPEVDFQSRTYPNPSSRNEFLPRCQLMWVTKTRSPDYSSLTPSKLLQAESK